MGRHRQVHMELNLLYHMEEELATQGTCGPVTQYAVSSHAKCSLCLFVSFQMRAKCWMEFLVEWRVLGCLVQLTCC
ncbi:hypothetical protein BDA96_03G139400 [Sorghum bicolor]|uniref:Uncharacterized protein n=2 Tax=Sorghum bicolor TaxID=4558 RepID=A0A921RBC3_SORBI|nr:hypothetical protein BDA96_03G139400 [Sorghum bicolor]KXG32278.1 hypothetical protein SORBI_3003G133300 [Sorghum bicolor]